MTSKNKFGVYSGYLRNIPSVGYAPMISSIIGMTSQEMKSENDKKDKCDRITKLNMNYMKNILCFVYFVTSLFYATVSILYTVYATNNLYSQFETIITRYSSTSLPLTINEQLSTIIDPNFQIWKLIIASPYISFVAYFLLAILNYFDRFDDSVYNIILNNGINTIAWIEHGFSSSLLIIGVSLYVGVNDIYDLITIGFLQLLFIIGCCYTSQIINYSSNDKQPDVMEITNNDTKRLSKKVPNLWSFLFCGLLSTSIITSFLLNGIINNHNLNNPLLLCILLVFLSIMSNIFLLIQSCNDNPRKYKDINTKIYENFKREIVKTIAINLTKISTFIVIIIEVTS